MTVRELIAVLAELDLDLKVFYDDDTYLREVDEAIVVSYGAPGVQESKTEDFYVEIR